MKIKTMQEFLGVPIGSIGEVKRQSEAIIEVSFECKAGSTIFIPYPGQTTNHGCLYTEIP